MEENLKHLKEIILDEKRIVTYTSISKELCVHVNEAKLLLQNVVELIKKKHPDIKLNINYIISGLSDTHSGQVQICPEKDLQKLRDTFKIVFYFHVYSVNIGCSLVDKAAYTSINTFEDIPLSVGLIKNDNCTKRTSDEIGVFKTHSQVAAINNIENERKPQKDSKPIKAAKTSGHENAQNGVMAKDNDKKTEIEVKQEIPSPNKKSHITKTIDKKVVTKTSKSIAGYFSKASNISNIKTSNDSVQNTKESKHEIEAENAEVIKQEKMDLDERSPNEAKSKNKVDKKGSPVNGTKNKGQVDLKGSPVNGTQNKNKNDGKESATNGTKSKKSINIVKPNAKVDKKRKRLLHVSDSESDHEENDPFNEQMSVENESDDEIPPTPTVNTVEITSGIVNPKKRRKIVDKTYTDEDGYILTKKEEIYESCSETEDDISKKENVEIKTITKLENKIEVSPKSKSTKVSKKKISPPQKGKQATMTNFFKKV